MGNEWLVKDPDDQVIATGETAEDLVDRLTEKAGMKDVEEYMEDYDDV